MNRLALPIALALAISAPAFAQYGYDPAADTQDVDASSPVDRQAEDTYRSNALPPVPAAPLPADRPVDMRPKIITGSADQQARETYRKNALTPVPGRRHHRRARRHRIAVEPVIAYPDADDTIVPPPAATITIPPRD